MSVLPDQLIAFQNAWGQELKKFLESPCGQATLREMHKLRPKPICEGVEHQAAYRLGAVAGYELYPDNLIMLSTVVPESKRQPEINYGVPSPKQENETSEK